jgi:hypothetical protein
MMPLLFSTARPLTPFTNRRSGDRQTKVGPHDVVIFVIFTIESVVQPI